jgi:hypothetical protein
MSSPRHFDFVRIERAQLGFVRLEKGSDYNSNNQDDQGDKSFLHKPDYLSRE